MGVGGSRRYPPAVEQVVSSLPGKGPVSCATNQTGCLALPRVRYVSPLDPSIPIASGLPSRCCTPGSSACPTNTTGCVFVPLGQSIVPDEMVEASFAESVRRKRTHGRTPHATVLTHTSSCTLPPYFSTQAERPLFEVFESTPVHDSSYDTLAVAT